MLYLKGRESDAFAAYAKRVKTNYLDLITLERTKKLFEIDTKKVGRHG